MSAKTKEVERGDAWEGDEKPAPKAKQAPRRRPPPPPPPAPPPAPTNGEPTRPKWKVVRECFTDIKPEYLTWLWDGVWLDGSLNLLTGQPGLGKTFVAAHLAACVSTGAQWPGECGKAPLGDVVFQSAEDSYASVLVHRVKSAGGDLKRLHRYPCVTITHEDGEVEEREVTLEDIDAITDDLETLPNLKLFIIDPITSYLGSADANDNAEVRRVLGRLVKLAEAKKFAVVMISHEKKMNVAAIHSPIGSLAFTALPRVVQGLFRDPTDDSDKKRLLLPIKNNHGDDRQGLAFELVTTPGAREKSFIRYDDNPEHRSADEVKAQALKALSATGKEHSEETTARRRQVKILEVYDAVTTPGDGWVPVSSLKERCLMNNGVLTATILDMQALGILEVADKDKPLPKGGLLPGGLRVVRRPRPSGDVF